MEQKEAVRYIAYDHELRSVELGPDLRKSGPFALRDRHYVGEIIPVRVLKIDRVNVDRIAIQVDTRDVFGDGGDNLSNCQPQCRYVGQVTDMRRGVVYVRLNNGVNAIAHTCYDARMPGRKDTVSFAVTRLDEAHGIAIGIITRIIKQNL